MKKILLTYEGFQYTNIGDYIQSLAARQYLGYGDVVEWHRDELSEYDGEDAKVIMNGWFTHRPENWPPSPKIVPLFVAFHLNATVEKQLLNNEGILYLKLHEPIGCRDEYTVNVLKEKGIDAYFSSCLTTTLGYTYKFRGERKGIYIVDPVHYVPEVNRRFQKFKFVYYYMLNMHGINRYINKLRSNNRYNLSFDHEGVNRYACLVRSYMVVKQLLSKEDLEDAMVLTQYHYADEYPTNKERFDRAKELIEAYASAQLVITSRIHCALPCVGLETPVVFLQNDDDSIESTCRFEGLLDMLNVIHFRKNHIVNTPFKLPLRIEKVKSLEVYKTKADELIKRCKNFIAG